MATITPVRSSTQVGVENILWETLTTGDTATAISVGGPRSVPASVQVTGTFGSGTCVLQGSNDGVNYATVQDVGGSAVSLTAAVNERRNG